MVYKATNFLSKSDVTQSSLSLQNYEKFDLFNQFPEK